MVKFLNPNDMKPKVLDRFNMTKNERLELNRLSKLAYNSSSKWQKLVNKGEKGPQVEKMDDGTERKYTGIVYYSVEEIKKIMLELESEESEAKIKEELENEAQTQAAKIKEMAGSETPEVKEETKENRIVAGKDTVKEILETVES